MSSINGNGKGNLLVSYIFHSNDTVKQIDEEMMLKEEISNLLTSKGYKFIIADDDFINKKLIED